MEFVETIRRLELIIEHSNRLNTLVNKSGTTNRVKCYEKLMVSYIRQEP